VTVKEAVIYLLSSFKDLISSHEGVWGSKLEAPPVPNLEAAGRYQTSRSIESLVLFGK
jgi:hypothetical protein